MKKTVVSFKDDKMIIEEKSGICCIDYNHIVGIFCDHPYLKMKILDKKDKYIFHTIKEIFYLLPDDFIICNRSSIVNLHFFSSLETKNHQYFLYLKTGDKIPVSNEYRKIVKEKIRKYLLL